MGYGNLCLGTRNFFTAVEVLLEYVMISFLPFFTQHLRLTLIVYKVENPFRSHRLPRFRLSPQRPLYSHDITNNFPTLSD